MAPVKFINRSGCARFLRFAGLLSLSIAALGSLAFAQELEPAADAAAEKAAPDKPQRPMGRLIRIPLPITGSVDNQVKQMVQRVLAEMPPQASGRPVLVLEFSPSQNKFGEGSDFERALKIARFLTSRELGAAKTVAFVPKTIKGHAVLVAMACEEIVMAPDAEIGDAGIDEPGAEGIDPTVLSGYRQIASRRRTVPAEVALGMLDKELEVLKVETEVSSEYALRSDLDELRKKRAIQSIKVLKRPGELAHFTGREARALGFVKFLADDRAAVAKALSLPRIALEDDPSLAGNWRTFRVEIKGPINTDKVKRTQRLIEEQMHAGKNFVCLSIDSPGGSLADSMNLANFLASLPRAEIRTVAYVTHEARGDAALIAIGCDQIVVQSDAVLGGSGAQAFTPADIGVARESLRESLCPRKARTWSLPAALLGPDLRVFRFTHKTKGLIEYFSEEEAKAQREPDQWIRGAEITTQGEALRLSGAQAAEIGLARHVVDDFDGFKQVYGLEDDLELLEPGWADFLIEALTLRGVEWLLLLIGCAAIYAELQAPGIGIGGFVAGICFLLWFWSKHLDGTAGWLEVLLFLAGISCILLEIFVLPGAGIFGLGGGALVIASLVLASQTFVFPHNDYQLGQLRDSLLGFAGVGVCLVLAAMVMHRYLPHSPLFSHMVLAPPSGEELASISHRENLVDFEHLLGQQGVTTTRLGPSGKARIGNQLVDVIADGEILDRGETIVVVEVHGNRVMVRSSTETA